MVSAHEEVATPGVAVYGASARDTAMGSLLAQHPDAVVAAIDVDGLFVDVPDSVPLDGHRVAVARSALDLVQPSDRYAVIDAWAAAKEDGAARTLVTLAGPAPAAQATLNFFDLTEVHGVFVGVVVATGATTSELDEVAEIAAPPPRVARTCKSELAVITHIDSAVTAMLGWTEEDMVGQSSLDFIHPDDHERSINLWMEGLSHPGRTCRGRFRHRHADGRWVWVELSNTNLLDDPDHGYVDCELFDISEEMEAHESVRASEQLLRRLTGAIPVGVAQFDLDRRIVYANDRLYELVGARPGTDEASLLGCVVERDVLNGATAAVHEGRDMDVQLHIDRLDGGGRRRCTLAMRSLANDDGTVIGGVLCLDDVTEEARMRTELEHRATFDELTGCVNRRAVLALLEDAVGAARSGPAPGSGTAVVFLDLDEFKAVNDEHGHAVGDAFLVAVASRLRAVVRGGDTVGRLGGDEFLVVCPDVADRQTARFLGERLRQTLDAPLDVGSLRLHPSASIGIGWAEAGRSIDAELLVAEADAAMYATKHGGAHGEVPQGEPHVSGAC